MTEFDLTKLIRPNVAAMQAYRSARDEFDGEAYSFLDANENPWPNGFNRYPDPTAGLLRERIAQDKGLAVEQVFCGHGSDEAIDLLMRAFARPGLDRIAQITPSYGMYQVSAALNDLAVVCIPLDEQFDLDLKASLQQLKETKARIIFLCSPNNPTGNRLDSARIESLLYAFNGLVVIDEAYIDFSAEASWCKRLHEFPNLVVLQTFSKSAGRAALRVGMALASAEIIAVLNKIKPPYNISQHSQQEALAALEDQHVKEQTRQIIEQRAYMRGFFEAMPLVKKVYPSEANFLLLEVEQAAACYQFLLKQGIVVRNRSSLVADTLRVTIGTPAENEQLISALQQWGELLKSE